MKCKKCKYEKKGLCRYGNERCDYYMDYDCKDMVKGCKEFKAR